MPNPSLLRLILAIPAAPDWLSAAFYWLLFSLGTYVLGVLHVALYAWQPPVFDVSAWPDYLRGLLMLQAYLWAFWIHRSLRLFRSEIDPAALT